MSEPTAPNASPASDWLVFECSACLLPLKVRTEQAGAALQCPSCGTAIVAPPRMTPQRPPPGPAPFMVSEANHNLSLLQSTDALPAHLATDRLAGGSFRSIDDPALAIPEGGLRVRKRKRRSLQPNATPETPAWEAEAAPHPAGAPEPRSLWAELTSATVGVNVRGDGSVIEHRKRFLKRRLPRSIEKFWLFLTNLGTWSLAGLGLLVLVGTVVAGWYLARSRAPELEKAVVANPFPEPTYVPMDEGKAAAALVAKFLAADSIDGKLAYVRFPDKVKPLMQQWYAAHPDMSVEAVHTEEASVLTQYLPAIDGMKFIVVTMQMQPSLNFKNFALESTPTDGLKVDWETAVGWQAMTVDEFRKGKHTTPQPFRVVATLGDYWNGPYDEATYLSCDLTYPGDIEFHLYGYVPRNSPTGQRLATVLDGHSVSLILSLAYRGDGGDPNQVTIHDLLSEVWFLKNGPAMGLLKVATP